MMNCKTRKPNIPTLYRLFLLMAASTPLLAWAYDWPAKPSAAVKSDLIAFLTAEASTNAAVRADFDALKTRVSAAGGLDWMREAYAAGERMLGTCEGAELADPRRRAALMLIDYPLHVNCYDTNDLSRADLEIYYGTVSDALSAARRRVISEVRAAKIPDGTLRIWRLYNASFVAKGPRHTALFDFTTCPEAPEKVSGSWTKSGNLPRYGREDIAALADLADVLFMTHPDGDHWDLEMLRAMTARGKPIVASCPPTWHGGFAGDPAKLKFTVLTGENLAGREIGGVLVRSILGSQGHGAVPCNIYHVTIDGIAVVHNGDNTEHEREKLLAKCPPANVLLATTWSQVRGLAAAAAAAPGFDRSRAVLVPSHDNEIGHRVNHRESYREMYLRPDRFGPPAFTWSKVKPLHWGESVAIRY